MKQSTTPRFIRNLNTYKEIDKHTNSSRDVSVDVKTGVSGPTGMPGPVQKPVSGSTGLSGPHKEHKSVFEIYESMDENNSILHAAFECLSNAYSSRSPDKKRDTIKRYRIEMAAGIKEDRFKRTKVYTLLSAISRKMEFKDDIPPSVLGILPALKDFGLMSGSETEVETADNVFYHSYCTYLKDYTNPIGEEVAELFVDTFKIKMVIFDDLNKPPVSTYLPHSEDTNIVILLFREMNKDKLIYKPMGRDGKKRFLKDSIEF